MIIFGQSLTRIRATRLRDDTGTLVPQYDWTDASEVEIERLSIQPRPAQESRDAAGVQPTEEWMVFSRRGTVLDLIVGDRARFQGVVYDVVGVPQAWVGHHSEVMLRKQPLTRLDASGPTGVLHQGMTGGSNAQVPYTP